MRKKYRTKSQITLVPPQIFLKEELYQLLEGKRDRLLNIAAMTLQRYARMFFVRKNFVKFRRRIIALGARCKGYVVRYAAYLELMCGIDFSIYPFIFQAVPPRSPQASIKVGCEGLLSVCTVDIFPFFKRHSFRKSTLPLCSFLFVCFLLFFPNIRTTLSSVTSSPSSNIRISCLASQRQIEGGGGEVGWVGGGQSFFTGCGLLSPLMRGNTAEGFRPRSSIKG